MLPFVFYVPEQPKPRCVLQTEKGCCSNYKLLVGREAEADSEYFMTTKARKRIRTRFGTNSCSFSLKHFSPLFIPCHEDCRKFLHNVITRVQNSLLKVSVTQAPPLCTTSEFTLWLLQILSLGIVLLRLITQLIFLQFKISSKIIVHPYLGLLCALLSSSYPKNFADISPEILQVYRAQLIFLK